MSGMDVAVLSYHGWEIEPERLASDVAAMRRAGWQDVSLAGLFDALTRRSQLNVPSFHVTFDDGAEGDGACADALATLGCPATFFVSLDTMTAAAQSVCRGLFRRDAFGLEDHSLRHARRFHTRHVVGFHSSAQPLMSSPERLNLEHGDPVCSYGGELARPAFAPDPRARELCREAARQLTAEPGTAAWSDALAARLVDAGLGSRRIGRLCVAGAYETRDAFSARMHEYLSEGRIRLAEFTGRMPSAFAHPWWQPSPVADSRLVELGYRMTFSGLGLCRRRSPLAIPRLFVSNDTPRPIDPRRLAAGQQRPRLDPVRALAARAMFA